jgi:hypothetical protein
VTAIQDQPANPAQVFVAHNCKNLVWCWSFFFTCCRTIQQEAYEYSDPVTQFLEYLFVHYDFDGAQQQLKVGVTQWGHGSRRRVHRCGGGKLRGRRLCACVKIWLNESGFFRHGSQQPRRLQQGLRHCSVGKQT